MWLNACVSSPSSSELRAGTYTSSLPAPTARAARISRRIGATSRRVISSVAPMAISVSRPTTDSVPASCARICARCRSKLMPTRTYPSGSAPAAAAPPPAPGVGVAADPAPALPRAAGSPPITGVTSSM